MNPWIKAIIAGLIVAALASVIVWAASPPKDCAGYHIKTDYDKHQNYFDDVARKLEERGRLDDASKVKALKRMHQIVAEESIDHYVIWHCSNDQIDYYEESKKEIDALVEKAANLINEPR